VPWQTTPVDLFPPHAEGVSDAEVGSDGPATCDADGCIDRTSWGPLVVCCKINTKKKGGCHVPVVFMWFVTAIIVDGLSAPVVVPHMLVVKVRVEELHQASSMQIVQDDETFVVCILWVTVFEQLGEDVDGEHANGL
jgi:hypothetical protein